jgi:putative chitinase
MISDESLKQVLREMADAKREEYVPYLNEAAQRFEIATPLRSAAFIAQTAHESAEYSRFVENLNYSAQGLLNTWPKRFTAEKALAYGRKPDRIASYVYANRLGNGNEASGDGWRYRGRGIIQITGKTNYQACGNGLGVDLLASPELLEQPQLAFLSAAWFWDSRKLNDLADRDDFVGITKIINGGTNGLADRQAYYELAKAALGIA